MLSRVGAVAVAVTGSLHEATLLIGQRAHSLAVDLVEQFVEATLFRDASLLGALLAGLAATLQPALPPALPAPRGSGRCLVALEAGVALREVVAEQRVLAAGLQNDPLLFA